MPQQNLNSRFESEISPVEREENESEAQDKVKKTLEAKTEKKSEKTGKERSEKYRKKKMKSSGHVLPKKKFRMDGEKREKVKILDPINLDQTGIQLDDENLSEQEESESNSEQNNIQLAAFKSRLRPLRSIAKDWSLLLIRIWPEEQLEGKNGDKLFENITELFDIVGGEYHDETEDEIQVRLNPSGEIFTISKQELRDIWTIQENSNVNPPIVDNSDTPNSIDYEAAKKIPIEDRSPLLNSSINYLLSI
jgi:hypothetical protein